MRSDVRRGVFRLPSGAPEARALELVGLPHSAAEGIGGSARHREGARAGRTRSADGADRAERAVRPEELDAAEEGFLTSALLGIMPLTEVDGSPVGT